MRKNEVLLLYKTKRWIVTEKTGTEDQSIREAAALLAEKEVIAFPTETVYGLGADATSFEAVEKIFQAKGRPADNPLIVHVADKKMISHYVSEIPAPARKLIKALMPGPLTVILKSKGIIAENVTAGLDTVAVRIPDHPLALALLQQSRLPLAAPSANLSGKPSPTKADHVFEDLDGRIAGILDGGNTGIGVESTVIDCSGEFPVILRPGGTTKKEIESVIGRVMVDPALAAREQQPKSPGMKYTHYAPASPLWLVDGDAAFLQQQIENCKKEGKKVGVMASVETAGQLKTENVLALGSKTKLEEVAVRLYDSLRTFKESDVDVILCESFSREGVGEAVMNRLQKAAVKKINQF